MKSKQFFLTFLSVVLLFTSATYASDTREVLNCFNRLTEHQIIYTHARGILCSEVKSASDTDAVWSCFYKAVENDRKKGIPTCGYQSEECPRQANYANLCKNVKN